jgi:hypothetical protein
VRGTHAGPQALLSLGQAPGLEAKALFEHLAQCHPGGVRPSSCERSSARCAVGGWRRGRVPRQLLTDHSSTATHQLKREGRERGFDDEYLGSPDHSKSKHPSSLPKKQLRSSQDETYLEHVSP